MDSRENNIKFYVETTGINNVCRIEVNIEEYAKIKNMLCEQRSQRVKEEINILSQTLGAATTKTIVRQILKEL